MIKRILSLQYVPLILLPLMLFLIGVVLWSLYIHANEMESLVERRNIQETQFAIALIESKAELLSSLDSAEQAESLNQELAILKNNDTEQSILIVDQEKNVVFYSGGVHPSAHLVTHPGVEEALSGRSGAIREAFPDSIHLISYGPIESLGWAFVIEEFWTGSQFARFNLTLWIPLLLIPLVFVFFLIMWSSNQWVLKPLAVLNAYAKEMGDGRYDRPVPFIAGIREINELHHEIKRMVETLGENQSSLRHFASAIQTGQEEERKRVAQELHDDTIQSLIHLDQRIQLLELSSEHSNSLREQIALILANLRAMIQDLRPSYLDELGLIPALAVLVKMYSIGRDRSEITLNVIGEERRISADQELALYRIVQESINNSLKHANANQIAVGIRFRAESITLIIEDDGSGIPRHVLGSIESHFGLRGMQERARNIGSTLHIESGKGKTKISLRLVS